MNWMSVCRLPLVLRTVRYLKPRQIAYQFIRRFGHPAQVKQMPGSPVLRQNVVLVAPLGRAGSGDESTFTFLNDTRRFDLSSFDWACPNAPKLWRYNLHYCDFLQEDGRLWANKAFLITDWIGANPQGTPEAWEPFPLSLRIVNWIKLFLSPAAAGKLDEKWLQSLYLQTLWLEKNIEYHLLANHYLKNTKALFFAGMFFIGADAQRWLKKAVDLLSYEIGEQVLPDGGHFERSPMYHTMVLEDCLDILNLCQGHPQPQLTPLVELLTQSVEKMVYFLDAMRHPDGRIALFNDAAFNIEASPEEIFIYFERVTGKKAAIFDQRSRCFPETGYFIMAPRPEDRLIVDCGAVGPDYQPSHSHCDTLSFELSLAGRRVIVDAGCHSYEDSPLRRYLRGNMGHNTLTVDGKNQSEVWGVHRCGHRAYPLHARLFEEASGALIFEGRHDGYTRLHGRPIHCRRIRWLDNEIRIEDCIEGKGRHTVTSQLHIHPELKIIRQRDAVDVVTNDRRYATISAVGPAQLLIVGGYYCPEFGKSSTCQVIHLNCANESLPVAVGWNIVIHGD